MAYAYRLQARMVSGYRQEAGTCVGSPGATDPDSLIAARPLHSARQYLRQRTERNPPMIRAPRLLSLAAILLAATSVPALGQTATAALTGVVQDSTGTGLASVEILVANVATGFEYGSITSESGRYWFPGLPPGDYDITASRLGVETTQYEGIALPVGKTLTLDMRLAIAALEIEGIRVVTPQLLLASTEADIAFSMKNVCPIVWWRSRASSSDALRASKPSSRSSTSLRPLPAS